MTDYAFRIVNVFAEAALAGNPLCVVEDARGLEVHPCAMDTQGRKEHSIGTRMDAQPPGAPGSLTSWRSRSTVPPGV